MVGLNSEFGAINFNCVKELVFLSPTFLLAWSPCDGAGALLSQPTVTVCRERPSKVPESGLVPKGTGPFLF